MDNIIINSEKSKSLLVQEDGDKLRLRKVFHVNEMMGGTYWLLDNDNNIKFKLNANQLKVMKIAMAMVNPKEQINATGAPMSYIFSVDKLLEIMGDSTNRLKYEDMPNFLTDLTASDNFNYRDMKGRLHLMHIFDKVIYDPDKQEVIFRFSWAMIEQFLSITDKKDGEYQSYQIGNIMKFQSIHTINFYELFKLKLKGSYQCNFEIDIMDLKLALDLCQYDKKTNKFKDEKYPRYYDFKKYILDKSMEDINILENSDMSVEYIEKRKGKKVVSLIFQVKSRNDKKIKVSYPNDDSKGSEQIAIDLDEDIEVTDIEIEQKIKNIIGEDLLKESGKNLTIKSCLTLYKKAKGNYKLIQEKVEIAKEQGGIVDIAKWLNASLKGDGFKRNKKKIDKFNDFEQREYDYDDLEKRLLGWK